MWISPANGGRPNPVTPTEQAPATPTWSPDGRWIAYRSSGQLMRVQIGSLAPPVRIADSNTVPTVWSPDGSWITAEVEGGIGVVSPDGTAHRLLFKRAFTPFRAAIGWSREGGTLFLSKPAGDHYHLSAFDLAKGNERVIADYPADNYYYSEMDQSSGQLYPSRDGKYLLGSRSSDRASVWLLEGVEPP